MRCTLENLGYSVVIPSFTSPNWITIAREAREQLKREQPGVVHLFNVPDMVYSPLLKDKGKTFTKLIYDYRSPWGIEMRLHSGPIGQWIGEYFERKIARHADVITAVNRPLAEKVHRYLKDDRMGITVIPNYPLREFVRNPGTGGREDPDSPVIFIGRISQPEGAGLLTRVSRENPDIHFWVIGDGPFSWWYRRWMGKNVQFFGWQPHKKIPEFIEKARICLIPRMENALTPYSTDRSIWKLNEYLNMGKRVIASGISPEEPRKNLTIVPSARLSQAVRNSLDQQPLPLTGEDCRFWEDNTETIRSVYESV
jgi:Glycosyltransferase